MLFVWSKAAFMLIAFESGFAKLTSHLMNALFITENVSWSFKNNYTVELASQEDAPNPQVIKR